MTRNIFAIIFLFVAIAAASDSSGWIKDQDAEVIERIYTRARALLGPEEKAFLEELLAADEAIMERQQRGIVDQLLAVISGVNYLPGIVGGPTLPGSQPQPQPPQGPNVAVFVQPQPQSQRQDQINNGLPTTGTTTGTNLNNNRNNSNIVITAPQAPPAPPSLSQTIAANDNYLNNQISKIIVSSGTRNVTGIVDAALSLGTPAPIREFVNGIVSAAYCTGVRRLLGRC